MQDTRQSLAHSRRITLTGALLLAGLVVAALAAILQLRRDAVADAEDYTQQLGIVLAEQTARSFQAVDLVLGDIARQIQGTGTPGIEELQRRFGTRWVHESLTRRLPDLPQVEAISIIDAEGRPINATRTWPVPDVSLADRAYFRHLAATPDPAPFIEGPLDNRVTGSRTLYLARGLRAADGSFLGVVNASIKLDYFHHFFAAIGLNHGTDVTILRRDGTILVHSGAETVTPGIVLPASLPWHRVMAEGGGHYRSPGTQDRRGPRFVSVHPLADYPLVMNVFRLDAAALAHWYRQTVAILLGVVVATLAFGLAFWALRRQIALIELAQAQLRITLEHMDQGLIMVDPAGIVTIHNRRVVQLLGLPPALMASRPSLVALMEHQRRSGEFADTTLAQPDLPTLLSAQALYERRRPDGRMIEARSTPLPGGGMVRTYTDTTARAVAEEMLSLAASQDHLTGIANRRGFTTRLDAALVAAQRSGAGLAVLCLDLDRFKAVNDTLGHEAGDRLLALVADRMRLAARGTDILARLGGDEFAVVLPGVLLEGAAVVAGRLLEVIRQPYPLGEETVRIGVSIGIAFYPADGTSTELLCRHADLALYQAKAAGRNAWRSYASADGQREKGRMALERDLGTAVEQREFTLAFQPIFDAASLQVVSCEALLRWPSPRHGEVSPAEFIPIAERTGLILPLGRWALEAACAEAADWAVPVQVAVNLSPAQFREGDLPRSIADILARTGLAPGRLDLEVTEGLLLEDTAEVIETMQALRGMGIRMVLDDFGTGHSGLSTLRGFPFDAIKIDRSFMRALNSDRKARALVEAMLAMARALGLEVVGEGVETPEQLALLRHLECARVQGFLLGRPMPPDAVRDKLRAQARQPAEALPS